MTSDFNFSQHRNFSTLIFWLWFFRLQLLKFRFWFSSSMIIQYGYYYGSFNTLILLLRLLTWWSLWTLRKYLNIFWLWKCLDFGTSTFEISFGIFFFNDHSWVLLYYGSFNTLILLLLLLTRWSLWTLRKYLNIFWLWKCLDFGTSTFKISFWIFFFNDHSIWVLLRIIQYIDNYCCGCWLGDPSGHFENICTFSDILKMFWFWDFNFWNFILDFLLQ